MWIAPMNESPHIVIAGGGITGLATAYYLRHRSAGIPPRITLLDAGDRLGGKLRTELFAGVPIDTGPYAFIARVPWAVALCQELELELVAPATGKTWLWTRGRLRPLPDGLVLGI